MVGDDLLAVIVDSTVGRFVHTGNHVETVVLPAPFGPMSDTISPLFTSSDRSLTAITPPNCMVMFSNFNTFSLMVAHLFRFFFLFLFEPAHNHFRQLLGAHNAAAAEEHHDHDDYREHDLTEADAKKRRVVRTPRQVDDGGIIEEA